ncbi:PepSY domain-containing protein [Aestuariivirga sp.]|uniref:PepSY domain-containing protein n=1 Tax=Aestuariivirga sp. TaxID=2650926 RepID=UPI0035947958
MASRRLFLALLLLGIAGPGATASFAKDSDGGGEGGGGGGGKGGSRGDNDGGKDDNDRDDSDRDDNDRDNNDKDDNDRDHNDKDDNDRDHNDDKDDNKDSKEKDDAGNRIRAAVRRGEAEPLRDILLAVRKRYKGEVVRIRLTGRGRNMQYRIRIIDAKNKLIEVRVNAKTARIVGASGL